MKLLRAFGTLVFALLFAGILTALASTVYAPIDGRPQNNVLIPVAVATFVIGWLFAFAVTRRFR